MSSKTKYINVNILSMYNLGKDTIIDGKAVEIDTIDGAIFSWFIKFQSSNKMLKKLIDDKLFCWASYQSMIDDMPYLKVANKRSIERRIQKLVDVGLFEKIIVKESGNKTYFHITELAYNSVINGDYVCTQEYIGYVPESTKVCTQEYIGVCTVEYNNSILDNSILDSDKKTKEKKENLKSEFLALLDDIKSKVKYKSKLNFTDKAFNAYKNILDKSNIAKRYIEYQNEKGEFSKRIGDFLLDYEAHSKVDTNTSQPKNQKNTNNVLDRVFGAKYPSEIDAIDVKVIE